MPTYLKNSSAEAELPAQTQYASAAQIQRERERLGITPAMLEERRQESLRRPF